MAEFRMPALGADMDAGTVVQWLVAPGDTVRRGDVVAVVDTDKSDIDVECFDSGVVERLLVEPGQRVAVGTPLAVIGARPGPVPGPPAPVPLPEPAQPRQHLSPKPPPHKLSPLVRKLAADAGLDLTTLHGTGRNGAVTRADVERALHPPAPAGPTPRRPRVSPYARRLARERGLDLATLTRPDRVLHARDLPAAPPAKPGSPAAAAPRAVTAALMARSKREIPHYYLATDARSVDAVTSAVIGGVGVLVMGLLALTFTWAAVHARILRLSAARWGRDWERVEPQWSGRAV
jgi:pyruvate dehydrogenase E2 component (dihydrolipoamide acetyltransferase)